MKNQKLKNDTNSIKRIKISKTFGKTVNHGNIALVVCLKNTDTNFPLNLDIQLIWERICLIKNKAQTLLKKQINLQSDFLNYGPIWHTIIHPFGESKWPMA